VNQCQPVLTQTRAGEPLKPGPHKIQGIGAGFVPQVLDLALVDRIEQASNEEAIDFARRLTREEASCRGFRAAQPRGRVRIAKLPESVGKTIVVILPDSGERYLSSILFDAVRRRGLPANARCVILLGCVPPAGRRQAEP